jgi:hypothetical protein
MGALHLDLREIAVDEPAVLGGEAPETQPGEVDALGRDAFEHNVRRLRLEPNVAQVLPNTRLSRCRRSLNLLGADTHGRKEQAP